MEIPMNALLFTRFKSLFLPILPFNVNKMKVQQPLLNLFRTIHYAPVQLKWYSKSICYLNNTHKIKEEIKEEKPTKNNETQTNTLKIQAILEERRKVICPFWTLETLKDVLKDRMEKGEFQKYKDKLTQPKIGRMYDLWKKIQFVLEDKPDIHPMAEFEEYEKIALYFFLNSLDKNNTGNTRLKIIAYFRSLNKKDQETFLDSLHGNSNCLPPIICIHILLHSTDTMIADLVNLCFRKKSMLPWVERICGLFYETLKSDFSDEDKEDLIRRIFSSLPKAYQEDFLQYIRVNWSSKDQDEFYQLGSELVRHSIDSFNQEQERKR